MPAFWPRTLQMTFCSSADTIPSSRDPLFFFGLIQKRTKKNQEKNMLPPTCPRTPAFFSGRRALLRSKSMHNGNDTGWRAFPVGAKL
jgi:hypothetical protein